MNTSQDVLMIGPYNFETLINLGINNAIFGKAVKSGILNLNTKKFEVSEIDSIERMEIFTDLYVGTILNNEYSEQEIIKNCFEIELPDEFLPYCVDFNKYLPILKWKNHYLTGIATRYNQLIIGVSEGNFSESKDLIFNITT